MYVFHPVKIHLVAYNLSMFEKHSQPVAAKSKFALRIIYSTLFALFFIVFGLGIGMLGYHHYEQMPWVDAFANAAMILSGMGPLTPLLTTGGKIFAGFYAIFSGLAFIMIISVMLAPIVHRFFHKFHLDNEKT